MVDSEIFLTARDRQRNNGTLSSPRDNDIFNRPALRSLVSVVMVNCFKNLLICFSVPKSSCSTRVAVSDTDGFSLQRFLVGGAVVSPTGPEEFETHSKCQGVANTAVGIHTKWKWSNRSLQVMNRRLYRPVNHTWTFSGDFGVMGSFRDKVAGQVLVWWQSLTWYFSLKLGTVGDIS